LISAIVLIKGRELLSASVTAPTRVAEISRARAFEIKAGLTDNVWIDDVLEIPP
jgi:hypothetical protein